MKILKVSMLLSLVIILAAGCSDKKSNTKKTTTSSGSDTITTDPDVVNDGTTANCTKGIYRDGATRCYYSDIPRITLSGAGNTNQTGAPVSAIGAVLWTSKPTPTNTPPTNLPSTYSQNNFVSDATFNIRIKAQYPYANTTSMSGRTCGASLTNYFSKIKVVFMLRRESETISYNVVEAEAKVGAYSNKVSFNLTGGTDKPYILEVIGIMTDHRCTKRADGKYVYGTPSNVAACNAGTAWSDIPLNTTNPANPTSCAAFDIEYSTDSTYDLPNS